MAIDLHIHTTASDGRLTPREVLTEAKRVGLTCIAITDHDTLDGIKELAQAGLDFDAAVRIIRGIEFSAYMPHNEVHILGLNIDLENEVLNQRLTTVRQSRWQRLDIMLRRLQNAGYDRVKKEAVLRLAGQSRSIGRAHIAAALTEAGYFASVTEAFEQLLHKGGKIYEPHCKLEVGEIISLIHGAGGKAVLAHPGLVRDDKIVQQVLAAGMDGIEVYHPRHGADEVKKYEQMAKDNGLLVSGGSDFHAIPGRFPEKLGIFTVDDAAVAKLISAL